MPKPELPPQQNTDCQIIFLRPEYDLHTEERTLIMADLVSRAKVLGKSAAQGFYESLKYSGFVMPTDFKRGSPNN